MSSLQQRIETQIDNLLVDMSRGRRVNNKISDFRVSSLPQCPIRSLLYTEKAESYGMDFYTGMGTAVHSTAQKWLTLGNFRGRIFACWKAVETGEIIGPMFMDEIPKEWDNYTIEYEEITISYNGLSGHVDLVVEILPGMFVVIDFKTTDLDGKKRKYPGKWKSFFPASRSSIIQISTYSTLLRKLFKLNIVAWSLVYVDRGKVIKTKNDYHRVTRPWTPRKHKHMLGMLDRACENDARLRKLLRIMDKAQGFSPRAVSMLKQIVVNRPCIDEESYDEWIDYKFYKGAGGTPEQGVVDGCCELKKYCLKGSKSAYRAVQRKL